MTSNHKNKKRTNLAPRCGQTLAIQGVLRKTPIEAWQPLEAAITRLIEYSAHGDPRYGGRFIESIGCSTPPAGHCWAIWVNGKRLKDRGISNYIVHPGDRIELKIEESKAVAAA